MSKESTKKDSAWLLPSPRKENRPPGLYLAATPIGNLGDITLRALDVLCEADAVICEDTRVTGKLLSYFGIKKKLILYNDHSKESEREEILAFLESGKKLVLVSDAGTPMISDPGYKLAQACMVRGIYVTSLPGANAPLTALQLSGLPSDAFCFAGFLPSAQGARRDYLARWKDVPATLVVFETGPRLGKALADIKQVLGVRQVAVAREMTKLYEEIRRGDIDTLIAHYEEEGQPKGEIVLVIAPGEAKEFSDAEIEQQLRAALRTMRVKEAASFVAESTGRPRKALYDMAVRISDAAKR